MKLFHNKSKNKFLLTLVGRILFGAIILCAFPSHAQVSQKKLKSTADGYYGDGDYRQALNYYIRYNQYDGGDLDVVKRMAICQIS